MDPTEFLLLGLIAGAVVVWFGTRIDRNEAHHEADELRLELEEAQRMATFYRQQNVVLKTDHDYAITLDTPTASALRTVEMN